MDLGPDSFFTFPYEQNNFLSHFFSRIFPYQKKFYMRALYFFYYKLSVYYWSFDYTHLESERLFEVWMLSLDIAYGEWLEEDEVQKWLGTNLKNILPSMQRYDQI